MKFIQHLRYLLLPFAVLYGLVSSIRNLLFDFSIGNFRCKEYDLPIISVGNITVGGTGKTPHTEWIIQLLKDAYNVSVLSRGYKRKTKGLVIADSSSTASDIGDEPMQMHNKFPEVQVVVAEQRVIGVDAIMKLETKCDVLLMDDAFQHRYVKPGFSILVMDYNRPFWKDHLMPVGELRELPVGKKRANIIIVSKCPQDISIAEQEYYKRKLSLNPNQSIFFTCVGYKNIYPIFADKKQSINITDKSVLLVSGIAQPKLMFDYVSQLAKETKLMQFGDHHNFSAKDINNIEQQLNTLGDNAIIVTTEKDAVRFGELLPNNSKLAQNMYSLPIEIQIINNKESDLKDKILNYVRSNKRIS
ncbi:tetraacyldisaccharide 4'-kinase [Saccharicrinis aurantiacus]|uniref:tetraacyldisaccharide 4'-kinase n=1 Tax=Saccharicrinis aurantiacus TaxID=1849719 RepID=UPI000A70781A|nr:tetraacyldisaccharide 4'-kinase [Saccharicrinis aurantiacus]